MVSMYELVSLLWNSFKSNFIDLKYPYKLTIAVTYHCNARCKMCDIWKRKSKGEMRKDEWVEFFSKNRIPWINLTGGEPFLRNDLIDIVKSMKDIYLLNTTTNGFLTERIVSYSLEMKRFVKRYIITVSIDGPEKLHNYLRGIDVWQKAVNTFKLLRENGVESYIGYTITPFNVGMLKETYKSLKRIIPWLKYQDFHLNFYHESEVYYDNKGSLNINEDFYKLLIRDIKFIKSKKIGITPVMFLEHIYLSLVRKYLKTRKSPLPCKSLSSSCFIDSYGNVYPCTIFGIKIGNLRESDFNLRKIFSSSKARVIRQMIKSNKCPGCWTPCEAYQTILGNILRIL